MPPAPIFDRGKPGLDVASTWPPDARTILFVSERTYGHISAMNPDGSELRKLTSKPGP